MTLTALLNSGIAGSDLAYHSSTGHYYPLTIISLKDTIPSMIKSFRCRETERLFKGRYSRKWAQKMQRKAAMKLNIVHAATQLDTLRVPPGNRLEALSGDRTGQHSIRINDQWRICFVWKEGHAHEVEIVDYHK